MCLTWEQNQTFQRWKLKICLWFQERWWWPVEEEIEIEFEDLEKMMWWGVDVEKQKQRTNDIYSGKSKSKKK